MKSNHKAEFKTIFIVDDEEMFQEGAKQYMQQKHRAAEILCYSSGEECIENMHLNPELIVLDHHLATDDSEAMNGLQTLQKIKSSDKNNAYVVILTSEDSVQVANDTMEHGAYDYIVKGETAFQKLDINCNHILRQIKDTQEIEAFKKFKIGFLAMIAVLIGLLYFWTRP